MFLQVTGFRYKNVPLEFREKVAFSQTELADALKKLCHYPAIKEAIILSTCNRTEIFTVVEDTEAGNASIIRFFENYHNLKLSDIRKYMFTLMHEDTVNHLYKVTSGLDSMVIGENEIVHQVKEAFNIAQLCNSSDIILTKLFQSALSTSKKVRTTTNISSLITDISSGAIELAKNNISDISNAKITIIGAGKMANLAVKYFIAKYNNKNITVLNRTSKPLKNPHIGYSIQTSSIKNLKDTLLTTDLLLVCTAAPHFIVEKEHLPENKTLTIVDIAIPRNVNPDIDSSNNITLYNIDNIQSLIDKEQFKKEELIETAENIIEQEVNKYLKWFSTLDIIPTIKQLRDKIEDIRQQRVDKIRLKTCPYSSEHCMIVEELSKQIVNTILHDPTVRLKSTDNHEKLFQTAQILKELYYLDKDEDDNKDNDE